MAWHLRAVETTEGRWACRHGVREFDHHAVLDDAIEHLRTIARGMGPAEFFVHPIGAPVVRLELD